MRKSFVEEFTRLEELSNQLMAFCPEVFLEELLEDFYDELLEDFSEELSEELLEKFREELPE